MNNIFFPQANDLNRLLYLLNIDDPEKLKDEPYVQQRLGDLHDRQARYYIHALRYLGFVDENKNLTNSGKEMRRKTSVSQEAELIRVILTDETIGTIYLKEKMLGEYSRQEIAEMLEERYPDSSESTCLRRATCVRAWINWIDSKIAR